MRNEGDRRFKRIHITDHVLMNMFCNNVLQPGDTVLQYRFKMPDFTEHLEVETINWNSLICAWTLILYHPSFPDVPVGNVIDEIEQEPEIEVWRLHKNVKSEVTSYQSWRNLPRML